nr:MAG: ORF1 [TTV-like mini virus]
MPWRRRWRWRPRYYRYRFRYRRPRKTFRRRYWRRPVRYKKRKLKRLTLKEWQPSTIRQCKVKGLVCLFLCNTYRLGNNLPIYDSAIVPEKLPSGGGFSIYQFTLENLYIMHSFVRNWWTQSNRELPLFRYLRCKIKLYQSDDVDYVFRYQRNFPMTAGQLTYPTLQPSVMMMLNRTVFMPSKRTKKISRGYKKIYIKPPELMTNKWFFQSNVAKTPLLVTYCTACSFDHYYIGTDKMSNNATIPVLNTALIQNRQFGKTNYNIRTLGTTHIWLWVTDQPLKDDTQQPKHDHLISLSNTKNYTAGMTFSESLRKYPYTQSSQTEKWKFYREHLDLFAGNPFHEEYLQQLDAHVLTLLQTQSAHANDNLPEQESGQIQNFTIVHNPIIYNTRYNPNADNGEDNATFLLENYKYQHGWDRPGDQKLILEGFPLYIEWWGFLDYQKQLHRLTNIDTNTILAAQTTRLHGTPQQLPAYVPLGDDFVHGRSPYEEGINPLDENRWYPMVQYQEQAINELLRTGPGVAKFNGKKTVEAKCEYTFYLKFGGSPAPMVNVKDPTEQPQYPIPNKLMQTNSLQDPTTPPEQYLYNFDQRRHFLTTAATKRIEKDWQTKQTVFTDGTTTPGPPAIHETYETSEDETSDSEKEEETLLQQLLKQRRKQQKLKLRIRQLLAQQK